MSTWIIRHRPVDAPRLRLFCFPYAGGAASVFRGWPEALPSDVEVCFVQLPGRGNRLFETAFRRVPDLVEAFAPVLATFVDRPYAFFGYSMGAIISFELARRSRRLSLALPERMFLCAAAAPQLPPAPSFHDYADDAFIAEIRRRFDGIPREVLDNPDLMKLLLPTLRADVELFETYDYAPASPLPVPISCYAGRDDHRVPPDTMAPWDVHTTSDFRLNVFSGGHFFVHEKPAEVLRVLSEELSSPSGGG